MHIQVLSDDSISPQACTYAEYRLFQGLSQVVGTTRVRRARLRLRRTNQNPSARVLCTIVIDTEQGVVIRVRAIGGHPYAAINLAIERLTHVVSGGTAAGSTRARPAQDASVSISD